MIDPDAPDSPSAEAGAEARAGVEVRLREVAARIDELVATQERMRGLLGAVVSLASDLSLEAVLDHVVKSACALVGARYGALGVIGGDGTLSHFVTVGLPGDRIRSIGDLPTGHGVLGLLIREPRPVRLDDLRDHPAARGFPPHHPPMASFLGVPVRVRDVVIGNLYLTEKSGGGPFTVEDEDLAVALAAAAGVAFENARLFDDARRRQRWLEACMEISGAMMGTGRLGQVGDLDLIARRALKESGSVLAMIAFPTEDGEHLRCAVAAGALSDVMTGRKLAVGSAVISELLRTGAPMVIADPTRVFGHEGAGGIGTLLVLALGPRGTSQGLLLLARPPGSGAFAPSDVDMIAVFGSHVALALELALAHRTREQLMVDTDRDRIARDLHDVVIQRLFAAGLSMQSLRRFTTDPVALDRIGAVTAELDETIRELRDTIYALRDTTGEPERLSSRILRVVRDGARSSTFTPRLRITGAIDSAIPPVVGEHLVAVISEGLSNAVRHSGADAVDISVSVESGRLTLVMADNGCGFTEPTRRSGLANMDSRAALLRGSLEIRGGAAGGTRLTFSVPTDHSAPPRSGAPGQAPFAR